MFTDNLEIEYIIEIKGKFFKERFWFDQVEETDCCEDLRRKLLKENYGDNWENIKFDFNEKKRISTNLHENSTFDFGNKIFEHDIVYSKSLNDVAIVEWHSGIGGWTVLFESLGQVKMLYLYTEQEEKNTTDLIVIGNIIENDLEELEQKYIKED